MEQFTWTSPDPLNNTAKTRSIYIVELQDAVNIKRAEISQSALSFIDQSVGKKFELSAIEELKDMVNQLALDFGYSGGVTHPDILGRNYVEITIKYNKPVAHYPIINDLRQALNAIELLIIAEYQTVIWNWYDNGLASIYPLATYEDKLNNPWPIIPDYIKTGVGGSCSEGYPTCNNTEGGYYRDTPTNMTDISLISINNTSGVFQEATLKDSISGGYRIGTTLSDVIIPGTDWDIDEDYFYSLSTGGSGGVIIRAPRDASEAKAILGDFGSNFNTSGVKLFVTSDSVILISGSKYGRMNKTTGVVIINTIFGFLNLSGGGGSHQIQYYYGIGYEKGGIVYATYAEAFNDGGLGTRNYWIASAVVQIDASGNVTLLEDLDTKTFSWIPYSPVGGPTWRFAHGQGGIATLVNPIVTGNNSGFYYEKRVGGSYLGIGTPSDNGTYETFSGTALATTDYKGDPLNNIGPLSIFHSDDYTDHTPATVVMTGIDFLTIIRTSTGGFNDDLDITWNRTKGAFRYRIQKQEVGETNWVTMGAPEADGYGLGDIFTETYPLNKYNDYNIRIAMETGQGLIIGPETLMISLL